jgi:hypothetical protein
MTPVLEFCPTGDPSCIVDLLATAPVLQIPEFVTIQAHILTSTICLSQLRARSSLLATILSEV